VCFDELLKPDTMPEPVFAVCKAMLAKNPADRITAAYAYAALTGTVQQLPVAVTPSPPFSLTWQQPADKLQPPEPLGTGVPDLLELVIQPISAIAEDIKRRGRYAADCTPNAAFGHLIVSTFSTVWCL
jgi:hypothetical protein